MKRPNYNKSIAFLRSRGVAYPEQLRGSDFSDYHLLIEDEERHRVAHKQHMQARIRNAAARGRETRLAQRVARRVRLAQFLRERPDVRLATIAREFDVSLDTLWRDRKAIGAFAPGCCVGCGRPL